jgi:hypothetical protein
VVTARLVDGRGHDVRLQHHAGAAAGRAVVDDTMATETEVPQRHRLERPKAAL